MVEATIQSTSDLKELFKECATYWKNRAKKITHVADKIEKALSDRLEDTRRESLKRKREALGDAVQTLLNHVRSPELILATTGTTSSGKSTLANFLIGDNILPSAAQEMSAGLVKICHHDQRKALKIVSTRGADWETGEWDDLNAEEIRSRLEKTMEQFRIAEKTDPKIEPVCFEIYWPIRLATEKARFGLPEGTRITILDLPGLKAMNDERNGPIIRKNITQALCLVAYNAEETDDKKQKELLNQVISQVTSWRKTPDTLGRMLFLLNRIDAFYRSDSNPEESLKKFRSYVTEQLRQGLKKELPEEGETIEGIEPAAISSLPALLAVEASLYQLNSSKQQEHLENIESKFNLIFPKGYWKAYPRDFEDLTGDLCRHLIQDTLYYSHATEFEQRLGEHINRNLPGIVLAGPMSEVSNAANKFLTELDQTLDAYTERTEGEADTVKKHLDGIENVLTQEADEAIKLLEKLKTCYESKSFHDIGSITKNIETHIAKQDLLSPIHNLTTNVFTEPFNELADYAAAILEGEYPVPSPLMTGAPTLNQFTQSLENLRNSPYGKVWQKGGVFKEGLDEKAVNIAINEFAQQLSIITNFIIPISANRSGDRVAIAFKECASLLISKIEAEANIALEQGLEDFPGLQTVFKGDITFPSFKGTDIKFSPKVEEWKGTEIREEKEISHERSIWTLFLVRHQVEKLVTKEYEVRGISVAGLGELFNGFYSSAEFEPFIDTFRKYIASLVDVFSENVLGRIRKGIDGYKLAIDQSVHEIEQSKLQKIQNLKYYKEALKDVTLQEKTIDLPVWNQTVTREDTNAI